MLTKHRTFGLLLALLTGLVVLVAACTGGDDDDTGPDDDDGFGNEDVIYDADDVRSLCNVLTRDDVEAILQTGISRTDAVRKPDGVACIWFIDYTGENLEHGGPVQVRFIIEGGRAEFDTKKAEYDTTDLEGLGIAAYTTSDGRSLHVLTSEETAYFLLDGSHLRTWTRPDNWQEEFATAVIERVCAQQAVPLRQPC